MIRPMPNNSNNSKHPKRSSARPAAAESPHDEVRRLADALFRAALECCRQHRRLACLVAAEALDAEQTAAAAITARCDAFLAEVVPAYERAASRTTGLDREEWWHKANMLWRASREHLRHHDTADRATRLLRLHSREKLGELAVEYDLEASALLGLRHALDDYRKVRPEAELRAAHA
ncbi:MAG TPA: hypothetical protein VNA89_02250 [Gemmatimonadaceae bacterium]|nr:hypothetical protein [Gemmatimonadaceae bacterium]